MYSITTHRMTMSEAISRFKGFIHFPLPGEERADDSLFGMEILLPSPYPTDPAPVPALLVRVPGTDWKSLRELVSKEVWSINWPSENLMRQQSYAVLGSEEEGLYVSLWIAQSMRLEDDVSTIRIILVGDEYVVDAHHHITGEDRDIFLIGCQAATMTSGINYNPHRRYEEKHLEEVAHLSDDFRVPGRIVCLYEPTRRG